MLWFFSYKSGKNSKMVLIVLHKNLLLKRLTTIAFTSPW